MTTKKPTLADVVKFIETRAADAEEQSNGPFGLAFSHRAVALRMIVSEIREKFVPELAYSKTLKKFVTIPQD